MFKKTVRNKIISIDNYSQNSYLCENNSISSNKKISYKNNTIFTTYLANKDMIIAPIEIGGGISDEDIPSVLENRAYEELGLDISIDYIINFIEIASNSEGRMFQLFIIERSKYFNIFSSLQKKVHYLDFIFPAPLLFKNLYKMDHINSRGVHCFLYFSYYDTFITFYKDGEYLYSKSIQYSFEQIYNKYCEAVGETVDETKFLNILNNDGMRATDLDYQQNIMKIFGEIFISINDIIIYTKRAYELENIDQMFIGGSRGTILGLEDYSQNYLGLYSSPLNFDFEYTTSENIEQLQYLSILSSLSSYDILNLTLFKRPPSFFKRSSGQALISVLLSIGIGVSFPSYHYILSLTNNAKNTILFSKENILNDKVQHYKKILKEKNEIIDALDNNLNLSKEVFSSKEKTLSSIYNKKVFYHLKSEQFRLFANDLISHQVKTYLIETSGDIYSISLVSDDDKKITNLIADISNKYNISSIDIKKISKESNSTFYEGILKVVLK